MKVQHPHVHDRGEQDAPPPPRPASPGDVQRFRDAMAPHPVADETPEMTTPGVPIYVPTQETQPDEITLVTKLKALVDGMPQGSVPPAVLEILRQPGATRTDLLKAIALVEQS